VKRKAIIIPVLILALFFKPSYSQENEVLSLSLEDCIIKALKDNLRIAVEVYNPELADVSLTKAKELFMPHFNLGFGSQRSKNPSSWGIEMTDVVITKYMDYSASLVQQIPTGGNLSLSLSSFKSDTNQGFQTINPLYRSTLRFDFTQPLLKGFGFKVGRKEIIIAQNNLDISNNQLKQVLIDTIYLVQEAYWNLVYSIENLKVKQQSLQLARDLLAKNKKEVEFGKIAPIEILNAEAVVASREADILQAEALIRRGEDVLKNLINLSREEEMGPIKIVPLDKPSFVKEEISLDDALREALEKRPDLNMKKKEIETKGFNLGLAKNQMLPGLDLQLSYWSPGVSGDKILYLDDNPFLGVIVGKEKGSATDSLRDALKLLYNNWQVALTLSIPLSNFTTRADYARARMELEKSQLEIKNLERQVLLEVKDAVRDVETNFKRVEAYRVARELAERRLEAEVKKLNVGLTTDYFVLEFQEASSDAMSMELKALVDYNLALARLEKVLGRSLEQRNIKIN